MHYYKLNLKENKFAYDSYYHRGLENLISKIIDVDEDFEKLALTKSIEDILASDIILGK